MDGEYGRDPRHDPLFVVRRIILQRYAHFVGAKAL